MGVAREITKRVDKAWSSARAEEKLAISRLSNHESVQLQVTSPAFEPGQHLPLSATAEGEGTAPPIMWQGVPRGAKGLVLLCEDPDAPVPEPFVHWLVYDLPPHDGFVDASNLAGG